MNQSPLVFWQSGFPSAYLESTGEDNAEARLQRAKVQSARKDYISSHNKISG